jgi:hypothetical protein
MFGEDISRSEQALWDPGEDIQALWREILREDNRNRRLPRVG